MPEEVEVGLGCEPDVNDPYQPGERGKALDRSAEEHPESPLLGASAPLPARVSLASLWPEDIFQGVEPSCVGHAVAAGVQIANRSRGHSTAPLPSRMWCWNGPRSLHQSAASPLVVSGTYIRLAVKWVQKHGYPTERDWDYEPRASESWEGQRITRREARPPLAVVRRAFDHRGPKGYYRVWTFEGVQRALAAGLPVVFGILLDDAFMDPKGPTRIDKIDGRVGMGHAMLIIGYLEFEGRMYAECLNWWRGWRESRFYLRADVLDSAHDLWVMDP